jgi:hypothetical protein
MASEPLHEPLLPKSTDAGAINGGAGRSECLSERPQSLQELQRTALASESDADTDGDGWGSYERKSGLAVIFLVLFLDSVLLSCIIPIIPAYLGASGACVSTVTVQYLCSCSVIPCAARLFQSAPSTTAQPRPPPPSLSLEWMRTCTDPRRALNAPFSAPG